jgi:uncharacterized membrane protein
MTGGALTPPGVWALSARSAGGYRRAWARERLADAFWPVPGLLLAAGVALAAVTANARQLGVPAALAQAGPRVSPGETASVLGIIASATLTFLGVVFTLTLVALQLASAQLSPRVVRMFVRSGVTKLAFGILLAAFSYCVAFLVLENGRHAADSSGLAVAMGLVTASLVVFLGYVASTMRLLQVAFVITRVAQETRAEVSRAFPPAGGYIRAGAPELGGRAVSIGLADRGRGSVGVLQAVDYRRLARLAERHGCVLALLARPGQYVPGGSAVLAVHGGAPVPARAALAAIRVGRARTVYQDPAYGLRQLADIAVQALSPAVNQPTTAVQVLDRLADLLLRIGRQPDRTGCYAGPSGQVRVVEPVAGWADLLDLALSEITAYGADSVAVRRRLLAVYDTLAAGLPAGRQRAVAARRAALLDQGAGRAGDGSAAGRPLAARADALGLG